VRVAHFVAAVLKESTLALRMDGIDKVLSGATDINQVRDVCIN
jgi:hypothetical protein